MKDFRDVVSYENLADYLSADFGSDLVVWPDDSVSLTESSITRWAQVQPIARVKCPGIGNLDGTVFEEGFVEWDGEKGAYVVTGEHRDDKGRVVGGLEDVIAECCRDGDMTEFMGDLIAALERSASEEDFQRRLAAGEE